MKVIASGGLARRLLRMGHVIVNLRPKRENPRESAFIFYCDRWMDDDVTFCMHNKTGEDEILNERLNELKMTKKDYFEMIYSDYITDEGIVV